MKVIKVGDLYKSDRTAWVETIEFNYFGGKCRYNFFLRSPHPQEVSAFKQGDLEISIVVIERVIFVPITFLNKDRSPGIVGDAAFSWWNLPPDLRERPTDAARYPSQAVLIDADNGIVKAICLFSLPLELTQILRAGIVEQIDGGEIARARFELVVANVQNSYSPLELAERGGIHRLTRDRDEKPKKGFG